MSEEPTMVDIALNEIRHTARTIDGAYDMALYAQARYDDFYEWLSSENEKRSKQCMQHQVHPFPPKDELPLYMEKIREGLVEMLDQFDALYEIAGVPKPHRSVHPPDPSQN